MKKLTVNSHLIISGITCADTLTKLEGVLSASGIDAAVCKYTFDTYGVGGAIRLKGLHLLWADSAYYESNGEYDGYEFISADHFLREYQVPFKKSGIEGSYYKQHIGWAGELNVDDADVTYTAETLVDLEHAFVAAVDAYYTDKGEQLIVPAPKGILSQAEIDTWRPVKINTAIAEVTELLMANNRTFTRHDIIVAVRELFGTGIEIEYDDYRDTIVDYIETHRMAIFNYIRTNDGTKWVYEIDTAQADADADPAPADPSGSDPTKVDPAPVKKGKQKRHTIPAKFIREFGAKPGDTIYLKVFDEAFYFNSDESLVYAEIAEDYGYTITPDEIDLHKEYTVDKNYNIRLAKDVFEAADIMEDFCSPDLALTSWVN